MEQKRFIVSDEPISIEPVIRKVIHPNAGAVNTFIGTVRELTNGKRTLSLVYEAYVSMARKKLSDIGSEINNRWPESIVAITHRTGRLGISDVAVVIAVSSPHRNAAFEASRYAIERIKEMVPIWKKEHWENGGTWVGNQNETVPYTNGQLKGEIV